ncbi:MAG: cytochrome-c oxidase, cbb3-type subunit I [Candidatus Eisenbacteria bacterium]|nr:cytochrome-c oxidase, cbb3-type subunit I [Candidatus Eisenbacteria bacterium]
MEPRNARTKQIVYDDAITRLFVIATVIWGVVGLLLGVIIATQLFAWQLNLAPWLSFGRLRPLHTNAAIFAFVGNMMFAGIYYSTQRLLKTRMASDLLSRLNFWGWQTIIVLAALTLPAGLTQSKEYAELIWPIDILVAVVWVIFAVNFFWTCAIRNERNLYVALWFYIATIVTIPVLYIVNNLQIPTSLFHSYSIYGGVQDALVQWWYGHNAVGFFLTTPILGIMYYFLPKAAGRPVYSYRLSMVHFWALVFVYIWAGPHHLLNSALPDWAQSVGMVFSVMLWAPSWGGMVNGLLTLRGAWDRIRTDPILKFFAAAITFYGMSTFEGPLLSLKSVNSLAHYTDWIVGHVHSGALGWNGFMAAGMLYWLVPRLWNVELKWPKLADAHFWMGTFGILLYVVALWISGVNQGLFWRALDADGYLKYPDFVEGLRSSIFLWQMRAIGGLFYLVSWVLLAVNLFATIRAGHAVDAKADVAVEDRMTGTPVWTLIKGKPVVLSIVIVAVAVGFGLSGPLQSAVWLAVASAIVIAAVLIGGMESRESGSWHRLIEGRPLAFTLLVLVAILAGGIAELVPAVVLRRDVPVAATAQVIPASVATPAPATGTAATPAPTGAATATDPAATAAAPAPTSAAPAATPSASTTAAPATAAPATGSTASSATPGSPGARFEAFPVDTKVVQKPYSPLELEGRDTYVREGCYNCHSQMIRQLRAETLRYGAFSRLEEFIYDHPFQWGSKRTGPDLHREGGKYPNLWHYQHLMDPRALSPYSNMPEYKFLKAERIDFRQTHKRLQAMRTVGVPYTDDEIQNSAEICRSQAQLIVDDLTAQGVKIEPESRMIALIAYLQRLGRGPQPTGWTKPASAELTEGGR